MRFSPAAAFLAVLILAAPLAEATEEARRPQTVVIGLDMSKSNPLVEDSAYAARVAQRTTAEIGDLPLKSRVMLRTFGSYDIGANALKIDEVISARSKPQSVAEGMSAIIAMPGRSCGVRIIRASD